MMMGPEVSQKEVCFFEKKQQKTFIQLALRQAPA